MSVRKKIVGNKMVKTRFCDFCGRSKPPARAIIKCKICGKDFCEECAGSIKHVCKKCMEPCPGCGGTPVYLMVLAKMRHCPNCGYNLK